MLNTIARWDGIAPGLELDKKGVLKEKAGIRHDWVKTRSPYCYRDDAEKSFAELIENLDANYILISYSTDGIIPFEAMKQICTKKGRVSVVTNEYTTYRGGKQSNSRQNTDIEFVLCIDTSKCSDENSLQEIEAIFIKKRLTVLFKQKFSKQKLSERGFINANGEIEVPLKNECLKIDSEDFFILKEPGELENLSTANAKLLYELLIPCACATKEEELSELIEKAKSENAKNEYFSKMIPRTLKKLASKKNRRIFEKWISEIRNLRFANSEIYEMIREKIDEIEKIATIRWNT